MFKKLLLMVVAFFVFTGLAFAQVDINKGDQAALDGIKGIGPKMSQKILDERKRGGDFKDWNDVQLRVKGIKEKSALKFSNAGLTVNGQSKNGAVPPVAVAANHAVAKSVGKTNLKAEPQGDYKAVVTPTTKPPTLRHEPPLNAKK